MSNLDTLVIIDADGQRATVRREDYLAEGSDHILVRLEDGQAVLVERRVLEEQEDGSLVLPLRFATLTGATRNGQLVVPVVEEEVTVEKRPVETGRVRLTKTVDEREVLVDQPLMREEVEVKRVTVNRMVDEPPEIRYEGDTMIIPILEEVVVVEIKLMVREEVRVTRARSEIHQPQHVSLRREDVAVERVPGGNQTTSAEGPG
jgi:uncharacterized protein (TIGR02271 family)